MKKILFLFLFFCFSLHAEVNKIDVWGTTLSPYVRKVIAILEFKNLTYEHHDQMPTAILKRMQQPVPHEFSKISPLGLIPAISIGDIGVSDSSVIAQILDKLDQKNSIYPSDLDQLAKALWLEKYADTVMHGGCRIIYFERVVAPILGMQTNEESVQQIISEELPKVLDYLESVLDDSEFFVGDKISIADFAIIPHLQGLEQAKISWNKEQYPRLTRYMEKRVLNK